MKKDFNIRFAHNKLGINDKNIGIDGTGLLLVKLLL